MLPTDATNDNEKYAAAGYDRQAGNAAQLYSPSQGTTFSEQGTGLMPCESPDFIASKHYHQDCNSPSGKFYPSDVSHLKLSCQESTTNWRLMYEEDSADCTVS